MSGDDSPDGPGGKPGAQRRIRAVIFDMDGLLLDSEVYWERTRTEYCRSLGCRWRPEDELGVKGHNSREWAQRIRGRCALDVPLETIIAGVSDRMRTLYHERLPLLPGAVETVRSLHCLYPLGMASSSPPSLIRFAMTEAGILDCFTAIVSSDDVGRGKPSPDVFLETARHLGSSTSGTAVFEDSSSGITAARAAGMFTIAVPNPHYPPSDDALQLADLVLPSLLDFNASMLP